MLYLKETVVVEGKYDKIKLSGFIGSEIITTDGFGIFKEKAKAQMLRRIAEKNGLIVITDSDSAGFLIRGHLSGIINSGKVVNVYIPEIKGKEKRKTAPSAEGLLGVEGVSEKVILDALVRAGINADEKGMSAKEKESRITATDLYILGFSGTYDCTKRREKLQDMLELPKKMSTSQLLTALNCLYSLEEFRKMADELSETP